MTSAEEAHVPGELLTAASLVLRGRGFTVAMADGAGPPMVLAENELFLMGVVEFDDARELAALEGSATLELTDYFDGAGAKRWDAYLVLLTAAPAENHQMSAGVADIVYNTQYVRRIVRWGVGAEPVAVASALRPFFPLTTLHGEFETMEPIQSLAQRMPSHGVSAEEAQSVVDEWLSSPSVDHA